SVTNNSDTRQDVWKDLSRGWKPVSQCVRFRNVAHEVVTCNRQRLRECKRRTMPNVLDRSMFVENVLDRLTIHGRLGQVIRNRLRGQDGLKLCNHIHGEVVSEPNDVSL